MGSCLSKRENKKIIVPDRAKLKTPQLVDTSLIKAGLKIFVPTIEYIVRENLSYDIKTAEIISKPKTSSDLSIIAQTFSKHPIFQNLNEAQIHSVSQSMELYKLKENEIVTEQGKPGNMFFIIADGKVEVIKDGKRITILSQGDSFGEIALIHNIERTCTIKSLTSLEIWGISRKVFKKLIKEINDANYQENKELLSSITTFQMLDEQQRNMLLNSLVLMKFAPKQKIFSINDEGMALYIIKEGTVSCIVKGQEVQRMIKGQYFGEIALLNNAPRNATVVAYNSVTCLLASKETLQETFGDSLHKVLYNNAISIEISKNEYLSILNKNQIQDLAKNFEIFNVNNVKISAKNTENWKGIYILLKGRFFIGEKELRNFNFIGVQEAINKSMEVLQKLTGKSSQQTEEILKSLSKYQETFEKPDPGQESGLWLEDFTCFGDCEYGYLSSDRFFELIGGSYTRILEQNNAARVLKGLSISVYLEEEIINQAVTMLEIKEYQIGTIIIEKNQPCNSIFILKTGIVIGPNINGTHDIKELSSFGEQEAICGILINDNYICKNNVTCWVLDVRNLFSLLSKPVILFIQKRIQAKFLRFDLNELQVFSLIKTSENGNTFIGKIADKLWVSVRTKSKYQIKNVVKKFLKEEIEIHSKIEHMFLANFLTVKKDTNRVYVISEFIEGRPLRDIIPTIPRDSEHPFRFYTACLIEILQYFCLKNIILRNLTTESLIIDSDGYLILSNLSYATICKDRTYTVIGSPYYMPPEMITHKGYNITANYWALGILLFEILCGEVPFGAKESDPLVIYEKILEKRIVYNKYAENVPEGKRIIEQMLCKSPSMRIPGGINKFKEHRYFVDFSWEELRMKKIKSPVIPEILKIKEKGKGIEDFGQFETMEDSYEEGWDDWI
ncbi:hypothetical protein SteCoe_25504 [Stentor coeruleus]|uniref:cGMP-dependent protein kinase n=1 Tax=Stentor coeruleus TaxID=5963 RepID=A0A1R2BF52_9CILI|nr:hypothetical protein SteCoe_25504 [Stentor coeruleus]